MIGEFEFKYMLHVKVAVNDWEDYIYWARENSINIVYSFGKIYFTCEEDIILFRLKFAI